MRRCSFPKGSKSEVDWWLTFVMLLLFSQWGAHVEDNVTGWGGGGGGGGGWSENEKQDHINVLELRAILFGFKSLCDV